MNDGWKRVPLSEVATLKITRVPVAKGTSYQIAGVLNAGQGMLRRGTIDGSETKYAALQLLHTDDLVMRKLTAWEGPITVVPAEYDGFVVSSEFPTFILDQHRVLPAFMRLVCQRPELWEQMHDRSSGTVQRRKRVSPSQLLRVAFVLPPVDDQKRIVDLVQAADRSRVALNACAEALDRLRSGLEFELFGGLSVPAGWEMTTLGEVADVIGGGTPSTQVPENWDGEINWITPSEISGHEGETITQTKRRITERGLKTSGARLLPQGAVLLTSRATIGAVAFAGEPMATNQGFASLVAHPEARPEFLMYWCRAHKAEFQSRASGSTFLEISKAKIRSIPIALPSLEEQCRVAEFCAALDDVGNGIASEQTAIQNARFALISDLLSGDHTIPADYTFHLTAPE